MSWVGLVAAAGRAALSVVKSFFGSGLIGSAVRIPLGDPEPRDAPIVRVTNIQFTIFTDEGSRGEPEFAEVHASLAERQEEVSLPVEELDVVEKAVHHINDAVPVHRYTFRSEENTPELQTQW